MIQSLVFMSMLAFALLAGGCLAIPLPPATIEGTNAAAVIGPAGSWTKPLKVGTATKAQVRDRLGPPSPGSKDDEWWYAWERRTGIGIVLYQPHFLDGHHGMLLRFDADDVLVAFEYEKPYAVGVGFAASSFFPGSSPYPKFSSPLPPPVEPD